MKKIALRVISPLLVLLLISTAITSCSKDNDSEPGPGGFVPKNMAGKWLHGNFAMANFWGYDGSYQGNPFEQSVAFDFKSSGHFEMYYIGVANDYGCRTESLSSFKGKVDFDEAAKTFTITPSEGTYRGFYSCASNRNFNRKATSEELKKQQKTFKYSFTEDGKWLMIEGSSFKTTTW
ncbi:hypothetical protein GCM10028803_31630 [Larkinella knui]|uniref:Lipocalin-like domain-containing protein n=1 Tax=Larkinella knui TaxID=2025310 RepID=A0A3P1CXN0_9BACT|nr:hypothetical protein [Larkinella knui]RRB18187.1 hypothetical protein EHT87_07895 [Larkinella knui]